MEHDNFSEIDCGCLNDDSLYNSPMFTGTNTSPAVKSSYSLEDFIVPRQPQEIIEELVAANNILSSNQFPPSLCSRFSASIEMKKGYQPTLPTAKKNKRLGRKSHFTAEDEILLKELVKLHGESNWSYISSIMKKWNRKQLREHYINYIKNRGQSNHFTEEEDFLIIQYVKTNGHKWKEISSLLSGISPLTIKNYYYKKLTKKYSTMLPKQKSRRKPKLMFKITKFSENEVI